MITKQSCLDEYFNIANRYAEEGIYDQLHSLMQEGRITTGASSLHTLWNWYGYKKISNILNKAGKSTNYMRALKRVSLYDWTYYINDINKSYDKALKFIEEQKALPLHMTQKQLLKKEEA